MLSYFLSEYIKIFGGNGTEVFALQRDSVSFNKSLLHIAFGESRNITIQVSLVDRRSYVKITYGILKRRLNLGKLKEKTNIVVNVFTPVFIQLLLFADQIRILKC